MQRGRARADHHTKCEERLTVEVRFCADPQDLGRQAAEDAAQRIRHAMETQQGKARIIVATGASQFETLDWLVAASGIDWAKVTGLRLDEYIGLPMSHPASFRRYLKKRLMDRVPLSKFHYVDGDADSDAECRRLGELIRQYAIDGG